MQSSSPTLLSKFARLVPVLLLMVAVAAAPALGAVEKHDAHHDRAIACCHSEQAPSENGNDGGNDCCGKHCHGCLCPCAKLVLISGLRLAPSTTSIAFVLPNVVLSALSLSDADPIFHPPRV